MPFNIPSTKDQFESNLAALEGKLGQTSPINDKAFLRVLAALEAGQYTGLYKWAAQSILGVFAITATGNQLDIIGNNYSIPRLPAEAAQLTVALPATTGTVIPITNDFVGDVNGVRYFIDAAVVAVAGVATINLTAKLAGVAGNLEVGDTLAIGSPVAGAESSATVTVVTNIGAERETDTVYRQKILDSIRVVTGGGNSADYRIWAQEVAGVARAYPFAGKPIGSALPSVPPDRTVYIEAITDIDPDGIAPGSMLTEVRDTITTDPVTGIARQPLGLTDATLYIQSIVRTTFYVTVSDLIIDANVETQAKDEIEIALDVYFRTVRPFIEGLDSVIDRNDAITDPSVSRIVQDIVASYGGSVGSVAFDITPGTSISRYQLNANETAKLGVVAYV